eukprot:11769514-Alexandrium_andersonii.AAC.1
MDPALQNHSYQKRRRRAMRASGKDLETAETLTRDAAQRGAGRHVAPSPPPPASQSLCATTL